MGVQQGKHWNGHVYECYGYMACMCVYGEFQTMFNIDWHIEVTIRGGCTMRGVIVRGGKAVISTRVVGGRRLPNKAIGVVEGQ